MLMCVRVTTGCKTAIAIHGVATGTRDVDTQYAIFLEGTLNSEGHTLAITENWYFCCILESARDFCTAREG